jgi:hypothetical protein
MSMERTHDTVGSWAIVSRETGKMVAEVYRPPSGVNASRYEVLTISQWLGRYNRAVTLAGGIEPTREHLDAAAAE